MATATKPKPPAQPEPRAADRRAAQTGILWAVYRFLASLKLAVICLTSLAAVLAYATFFESWYGTKAVQETIYRSWWFGVILAFLGANIFCAAAIRYPWKARQTGFVVTHVGLLIVLLASVLMARFSQEGQIAFVEGERSSELIISESPVFKIRSIDPKTGKPAGNREYLLDFHPGAFAWPAGRTETLTRKGDPFELKVKSYLPASIGRYRHTETKGEDGQPMLRLGMSVTPPNALRPMDVFRGDIQDNEKWFTVGGRLQRKARTLGGIRVVFQYLDRDVETKLDDFLNPPKSLGDAVRLHYTDTKGMARVYEWLLEDDQKGHSVTLPDSDLKVTFLDLFELPGSMLQEIDSHSGEQHLHGAKFEVRKGESKAQVYYGWEAPLLPNTMDDRRDAANPPAPLLRIGYFPNPHLGGQVRGQLELVAIPGEKLFHRYTNKAGVQSIGPIEENKELKITGGPNQPMALAFEVKDYFPSGKESFGFVPMAMPKGKEGEGTPAMLLEMKSEGETKEFWMRSLGGTEPNFTVFLPDGSARRYVEFDGSQHIYEVGLDVDRTSLPFNLKLTDFDVRFDRGTAAPRSYTSKVLLSDEDRGIKDEPRTITMNEPLTYGWWTCYQSSYREMEDPMTGQKTGQFMSILQTRKDPVWPVMYAGCMIVVLGSFIQFYMRAGVFTDGGKKERARAERRNAAPREAAPTPAEPAPAEAI